MKELSHRKYIQANKGKLSASNIEIFKNFAAPFAKCESRNQTRILFKTLKTIVITSRSL